MSQWWPSSEQQEVGSELKLPWAWHSSALACFILKSASWYPRITNTYSEFFNQKALTTTIPAQLVKKYKIPVVPVFIERINEINYKISIKEPINF